MPQIISTKNSSISYPVEMENSSQNL
uniref:Uncharacterized protein n=1 Tax=Arundo donax TaxID=35708 RepID=A0A0A8Y9K5_ARUDO